MYHALRKSRDRIGDINAQVEDTLAGIRVVNLYNMQLRIEDIHEECCGLNLRGSWFKSYSPHMVIQLLSDDLGSK